MAKYTINMNTDAMSFEELEIFEDIAKVPVSDAFKTTVVRNDEGHPVPDPDDPKGRPLTEVHVSARALKAMVFVNLRRQDPDITLEQVNKITLNEIDFFSEGDDDDNSEGKEE